MRVRQATIDRAALAHNFEQIRRRVPRTAILAMVKSNAYGHGLERVAKTLTEADGFGVACIEEVARLRACNIRQPIVIMTGFNSPEALIQLHQLEATAVIHNEQQLAILAEANCPRPLPIWVKVDIGMGRLGFSPTELTYVLERLANCRSQAKIIGLMAHFSSADDPQASCTPAQITLFTQLLATHRLAGSLSHSAGLLAWPDANHQMVRPGISLYGVSPFSEGVGADLNLRPVMTLRSQLLAIHQLPKGAPVSYGGQFVCPADMRVGVVEMGYGDGYPRHAVSGTPLLVGGRRCTLIGRVCMDMLMVDLRTAPDAVVGTEVVLWGQGLPIEDVARSAGTIGYELLCHVSQRVSIIE